MITYNGDDFQVFLVRAFSHDQFFHSIVCSVDSKLLLFITHTTSSNNIHQQYVIMQILQCTESTLWMVKN